jgi:predicted DsbA family dithiol-disulfide isomerase
MKVEAGTIAIFADVGCPWAHLAVFGLHEARSRLDLEEDVSIDVRAFPLEMFNEQPTPAAVLAAEISVVGALGPSAGWSQWKASPYTYPVTTLLPMEAVYAAKDQGLGVSDHFDRALRRAFFEEQRCISLQHEILRVAKTVDGLDAGDVETALKDGTYRSRLFADMEVGATDEVKGSPHVFLSGGRDFHNPGIEMHWEGKAFPVVDSYDANIYDEILKEAAN